MALVYGKRTIYPIVNHIEDTICSIKNQDMDYMSGMRVTTIRVTSFKI